MKTIERSLPNNNAVSLHFSFERSSLNPRLELESEDAAQVERMISLSYDVAWSKVTLTAYIEGNPDLHVKAYFDGINSEDSYEQFVESDLGIDLVEQALVDFKQVLLDESRALLKAFNSCNEYLELDESEDLEVLVETKE